TAQASFLSASCLPGESGAPDCSPAGARTLPEADPAPVVPAAARRAARPLLGLPPYLPDPTPGRRRHMYLWPGTAPETTSAFVRSAFSSVGGQRTGSGCRPLGPVPAAPVHIDRAPLPATEAHSAR